MGRSRVVVEGGRTFYHQGLKGEVPWAWRAELECWVIRVGFDQAFVARVPVSHCF